MKALIFTIIGILFISYQATAQESTFKKVEGIDIHTSDVLYKNDSGEYFAKTFYVTFNHHITKNIAQAKEINSSDIISESLELKRLFIELENQYDLQSIERAYSKAVPNDTIRYNKKGKRVIVSDLSKRYKFTFSELQSFQFLKSKLKSPDIRYVEPPEIIQTTSNFPDDPYYNLQWSLKLLQADKVFNITKGGSDIIIGINDLWTSNSSGGVHEELSNKIIAAENNGKYVSTVGNFSHGPRVAAIAVAGTNNGKGVASLGGSFKLATSMYGYQGLIYFRDIASYLRPDVINMSWCSNFYPSQRDVIEDLLSMGIVMVGATANTTTVNYSSCGQSSPNQIFTPYPASYNYPDSAFQVIATTATQLTDDEGNFDVSQPIDPFQYEERFRFQDYGTPNEWFYNYGLSNNPVMQPDSAFTDIAAPSARMYRAKGEKSTNDYHLTWGATSEAAPLVTSVVGMMLSVNPDLGVREVYDIITSSTDYDDIVVPPGASNYYHPDGIRKYNKYIGYGRVNAYKAVLASVPKITQDVTSNTTWSGYVHLENTISVDNTATLTIEPGTTVLLGDNASLYILSGSTLLAVGTQSKPIKFIRADVDNDWGRIALYSSAGNSIKWALFDGGYINLSIASKNNTIAHSTFRNASFRTMQGWHNQDGSGNASATISYSLIENSATVGLVSHYLDLDLSYTTIRNNTQAGLYVLSNSVKPFHHNKITGNGGTSRDGIEVTNSGTLLMYGQSYGPGYNEIQNNGDDQISNYGTLLIGEDHTIGVIGGYNSIYGNYSGSRYLVYNGSSSTVQAEYVWWGQYPVQPGMTAGSVQFDMQMLTSDPTIGQNPGAGGQVPAKIRGGNSTEQDIIRAYNKAVLALGQAETNQQAIDEVYALFQLAGISENKELKDRFSVLIQDVAQANRAVYSTQQKNNLIQDYAKVLYAKALIRDEHYGQAQEWLQEGDFSRLTGKDQQDYLHLRMVTEVYHGSYETALSTLEQLYALEQTQGEDIEELKARYSTFEEDIVIRLKEKGGGDNRSEKLTERAEEQQEFGLQNYPNPFNPTTNINFSIPQKGMVSLVVYDVLGREVATLVNGTLPAGKQSIRFDASNLSNGMYLYKLRVNNQEIVRKMTLIK